MAIKIVQEPNIDLEDQVDFHSLVGMLPELVKVFKVAVNSGVKGATMLQFNALYNVYDSLKELEELVNDKR